MTIGTFDMPHIGHAILVDRCRQLGDHVIVGVNTDRFVSEFKGVAPVYTQDERAELMMQLPGVFVDFNDGPGRDFILKHKPDALVIGNDWLGRDYLKQIDMQPKDFWHWGITLVYVPYTEGISATELKWRLKKNAE